MKNFESFIKSEKRFDKFLNEYVHYEKGRNCFFLLLEMAYNQGQLDRTENIKKEISASDILNKKYD